MGGGLERSSPPVGSRESAAYPGVTGRDAAEVHLPSRFGFFTCLEGALRAGTFTRAVRDGGLGAGRQQGRWMLAMAGQERGKPKKQLSVAAGFAFKTCLSL